MSVFCGGKHLFFVRWVVGGGGGVDCLNQLFTLDPTDNR